jgi:hypothetical protein
MTFAALIDRTILGIWSNVVTGVLLERRATVLFGSKGLGASGIFLSDYSLVAIPIQHQCERRRRI